MPITTRTFRVFVSSTFEDLKEERNALQREVFPKLRELCEQHGARFQAIDLRWGVRDEAALDQQTLEICLREIRRCQATGVKPNFIVLLGDRYGWQPLPARIAATEFDALLPHIQEADTRVLAERWYRLDENAVPPEYCLQSRTGEFATPAAWNPVEQMLHQTLAKAARAAGLPETDLIKYEASATHQEILAGLGETEADREHVFGFFRRSAGRTDPRLSALKLDLYDLLPGSRRRDGNIAEFAPGDTAALCDAVFTRLRGVIEAEAKRFKDRPVLDLEVEAHDRFAEDRCRIFTGRQLALNAIADYVGGPERRPLVLQGESGSGKSAVMAKASKQYGGPGRVIRRFIGASPESASGQALLAGLCQQIAPGETPVDYAQLVDAFKDRLATAAAKHPLILFIDALDQLAANDPARSVAWLQRELPPNVKIIVSTTGAGEPLPDGIPLRLEPMAQAEGRQALSELLREVRRTLQPWQHETVLAHFERCCLPLYLKLAAQEGVLWKSYMPQGACELGEGVAGVIDTLLDRLASNANHGPTLVERSLGYLAAARYGLTEGEALDVLTADDAVWSDFDQRKRHAVSERRLPVVVWSRLSLDLEPYLVERAAPGGIVISFFHRQLAERVAMRFLAGAETQTRHADLARHFSASPVWLDEGRQVPDARRAAELVFQQRRGRQWTAAEATLFDCRFLFAKVAAGMVLDLDDDCKGLLEDAAEIELPKRDALRLIEGTLQLTLHVVAKDPGQFASQMRGRLIAHQSKPEIAVFLNDFDASTPRPRLRPLRPALEAAGGAVLRILKGHTHVVEAVALSADGKRAVSGSDDKTVRVWDLEGNQPPRVLEGHMDRVKAAALSSDGRRAVSGSWDETVRVWDLEGSRPPRLLKGQKGAVRAVALSADGGCAASGSDDKVVLVWNLSGSNWPTCVLEGHTDRVTAVALSSNGNLAVSGSDDCTVRVWDLEGKRRPRVLAGHSGPVFAVALSGDGKRAASGSWDHIVRVWDLEGSRRCRRLRGHTSTVHAVALSADGKLAVSGGDNTVRVWDVEGQPPRVSVALFWLLSHLFPSFAERANRNRSWFWGWLRRRVISPISAGQGRILEGHTASVEAVALSSDGGRAVSGSSDQTLRVWDLEANHPSRVLKGQAGPVWSVALSGDARLAASGSNDCALRIWKMEDNKPPRLLEGHTGLVRAVALSADGKLAVSGSQDRTLRVWDLGGNQPPRVLEGHTNAVNAVALSGDARRAVSGSEDCTLRVWDLEGNQPSRPLEGHKKPVSAVALSRDGRRAVSASHDGTLRVWDLEGNQPPRVLIGREYPGSAVLTGQVSAVALSADGRRAVSGTTYVYTLLVWDLEGNQPPLRMEGHTDSVTAVAMSADGKRAASGSRDKTLRISDTESGVCLAVFTCADEIMSCAWAGGHIAAADKSGHLRVFAWEE